MSITASQVKTLRDKTGAGMMDCKLALTESQGDIEAAIDWLRKKGIAKADKKSGRVAAEGLIGAVSQGGKGVLVEVNSETDFVARNADFQEIVSNIAKAGLETDGSLDQLLATQYPGAGELVSDRIKSTIARIGENISLRRVAMLQVSNGVVQSYVHNNVANGLGKIGVLVALETSGDQSAAAILAHQLAMHVAANNPLVLKIEDLDPALVERERSIFIEQSRQSGRPEEIIGKMVEGRIRKFYEENVMLSQSFLMNPEVSVATALEQAEKTIGAPVALAGYVRFVLGEGIEKAETDFAADVASMASMI